MHLVFSRVMGLCLSTVRLPTCWQIPTPGRVPRSLPSLRHGDDHHSLAHPPGQRISWYQPSGGPLFGADDWIRHCPKPSISSSLQPARARVIFVPHAPQQAFGAIPITQTRGRSSFMSTPALVTATQTQGGSPINSTVPHWLGSNNVITAADLMCIYYGLPTASFPLVPIPTLSLCLGQVGGCPVVGGLLAIPCPARPHPTVGVCCDY